MPNGNIEKDYVTMADIVIQSYRLGGDMERKAHILVSRLASRLRMNPQDVVTNIYRASFGAYNTGAKPSEQHQREWTKQQSGYAE